VLDGKSLVWPGVKDPWLWEPVISKLLHPIPVETTLFAAASKCRPPALNDLGSEGIQRSPVRWHCVVCEIARNDLFQPSPLFWDCLVHPLPQLAPDLFELRLPAIAPGPPL
jgi:hypothetical protein